MRVSSSAELLVRAMQTGAVHLRCAAVMPVKNPSMMVCPCMHEHATCPSARLPGAI